jgi:hypothetical protein
MYPHGLKFDKIRSCGNGLFLLCPYHDDPDNIYVIGIGLSRHLTMTPEKARREGIRCVDIESVYWQCVR